MTHPRHHHQFHTGPGRPGCMSQEEWQAILETMARAFEWCASDGQWTEQDPPYVAEGLALFAKHFRRLWW